MQVVLAFRGKANFSFSMILTCIVVYSSYDMSKQVGYSMWLLISVSTSLVILAVAILVFPLIQLIFISKKKGTIGSHIFQIDDSGFYEKTTSTELKTGWGAISSAYKTKNYLYIKVNMVLVHVIPKRSFQSENDFFMFVESVNRFIKEA